MAVNSRLYLSFALISLLMIETLFLGNSFSLQWHSPKLMYQVSAYLVPVKLALTGLALWWLSGMLLTGWRKYARVVFASLAVIHISMLTWVCLAYLFLDFAPQAKQYRLQGNIAVYTADPGAMGRAYHYFSYVCRNDYGFYQLTPISRLNWLGEFEFTEQHGELVITGSAAGTEPIRLAIAQYQCS